MLRADTKKDMAAVFTLAIPIIAENILQTLLGTVDTYFAGQLHDNAIAAIGLTNLFVNLLVSFYTAVSVGSAAVVARSIGRRDQEHADLAIRQSISLGVLMGLSLGGLSAVFCAPILRLTGAEEELLQWAVPYFLIVVGPSVLLCLSQILSSCLRAAKDTVSPLLANGLSNLLNIALNALFIQLGMGVFGLGLATTLSRLVTLLILQHRLQKTGHFRRGSGSWAFHRETLASITRIGIPAGLEKLFMRVGQLLYNGIILSIGTSAYVAHNIGGTIENYAYILVLGFSMSATTLVGVSLGENDPRAARRLTFLCYKLSVACVLVMSLVFFFGSPFLATLFTDTPEVQAQVVLVLRLVALFQPVSSLYQILAGALQGAGDTKPPMYATLVGIWIVRVGLGSLLALPCGLGLAGFWLGCSLDNTLRGLFLLHRFLRGSWQTIKL